MKCLSHIFAACVTLIFLTGLCAAQERPQVALGQITKVTLDGDGRAEFTVNVPRRGVLVPIVFPNAEWHLAPFFSYLPAGPSDGAGTDIPEDEPADTPAILFRRIIVEPGAHIVLVTYRGADKPAEVQLRLVLEPALDPYEPNDTLDTAHLVALPFLGLINLLDGGEDWFRMTVPRGDIIGVQLKATDLAGLSVSFYQENGDVLYTATTEAYGISGMRYFPSDGGEMFVQVINVDASQDWADGRFTQLEIAAYAPDPFTPNVFVKIDMGDDVLVAQQIDYVGGASGARVADASEAGEITAELIRAVVAEAPKAVFPLALVSAGILIAIAALLIGVLAVGKHRRIKRARLG